MEEAGIQCALIMQMNKWLQRFLPWNEQEDDAIINTEGNACLAIKEKLGWQLDFLGLMLRNQVASFHTAQ